MISTIQDIWGEGSPSNYKSIVFMGILYVRPSLIIIHLAIRHFLYQSYKYQWPLSL
jgi:hypothetical protein